MSYTEKFVLLTGVFEVSFSIYHTQVGFAFLNSSKRRGLKLYTVGGERTNQSTSST